MRLKIFPPLNRLIYKLVTLKICLFIYALVKFILVSLAFLLPASESSFVIVRSTGQEAVMFSERR